MAHECESNTSHLIGGRIKQVLNHKDSRTKYTKNEIRIYENGVCEIDVYDSFGNYKATGTISEDDLPIIEQYKWYQDSSGYLTTTINGKKVRLHRLLFPGVLTDHFDENKMNNLRSNLQQIPHSTNTAKTPHRMFNPYGVTGIFFTKNNTWQAHIVRNGVSTTKNFKTKEEAILMRYIWELNTWGKNAPQREEIKLRYPRLSEASEQGFIISENIKLALALLKHFESDLHCPCKVKKNEDTLCMCKEFREQNEPGYCHCGLYYKEEVEE